MKIVVIGGSGMIGSKLVTILRNGGHDVVAASPSSGVNTITGEGMAEVFEGAEVVVDVTNSPSLEGQAAMEFFKTSTANLIKFETEAAVKHHLVLSIVGTDRLAESGGYFGAKLVQEDLVRDSGIPYSIVRATQFFEFIGGIADAMTDGDTVRAPAADIQPIAADDVARMLADVVTSAPANAIIEIAGPETFHIGEIIGRSFGFRNDPRKVVTDPNAPYFGARLKANTLVPSGDARLSELRFEA